MIALLAAVAAAQTVVSGPASIPGTVCPENPRDELELAIQAVDKATEHDAAVSARQTLSAMVTCQYEIPAQNVIERLHQAMALASYRAGDLDAAKRSMLTARLMAPAWKLSPSVWPATDPYAVLYKKATHPGELADLAPNEPEVWIVDGIEATRAPAERAFLLQVRKGSKIVWSGYLWELADVPTRAPIPRDPRTPPHVVRLGAAVTGGAFLASQTLAEESTLAAQVWSPERGAGPSVGGELLARITPRSPVGVEVAASILGPSDPVEGGGASPSARAVVLLGTRQWVGEIQPYGNARIGGGIRPARAWTTASGVEVWTLPSAIVGVEGGIRDDQRRLGATLDTDLSFDPARPLGLAALRFQVDGGLLVSGPLAIEALVALRHDALPYFDGTGAKVGHRRDLDLHVGAGVALWY